MYLTRKSTTTLSRDELVTVLRKEFPKLDGHFGFIEGHPPVVKIGHDAEGTTVLEFDVVLAENADRTTSHCILTVELKDIRQALKSQLPGLFGSDRILALEFVTEGAFVSKILIDHEPN